MKNMEPEEMKSTERYGNGWERPRHNRNGRIMGGLLLVVLGLVLLAYNLNTIFLPRWLFSWPVFLIALGLFVGARHSFRKSGWIVLVLIGFIFLADDLLPGFSLREYFWPILIIGIGLWVMLKPRRDYYPTQFNRKVNTQGTPEFTAGTAADNYSGGTEDGYNTSTEDYVDATTIFGGTKKNIISKNFKGGEIVSVFGGTEINLTQADMQHPVVIETTQIFGGTTLIVPPHWEVKSEVTAIMGGVSDKRPVMAQSYEPNKVLVVKGMALFGGLNLASY